ncbi:hypothetical protein AURDEDRAFT_123591 [Auricularia subglabra TFB-10046 SS5]|nr:hypothetical protein AURDEDRAFT_123591 [Auricularia subglabra TFB-10046 SS5]
MIVLFCFIFLLIQHARLLTLPPELLLLILSHLGQWHIGVASRVCRALNHAAHNAGPRLTQKLCYPDNNGRRNSVETLSRVVEHIATRNKAINLAITFNCWETKVSPGLLDVLSVLHTALPFVVHLEVTIAAHLILGSLPAELGLLAPRLQTLKLKDLVHSAMGPLRIPDDTLSVRADKLRSLNLDLVTLGSRWLSCQFPAASEVELRIDSTGPLVNIRAYFPMLRRLLICARTVEPRARICLPASLRHLTVDELDGKWTTAAVASQISLDSLIIFEQICPEAEVSTISIPGGSGHLYGRAELVSAPFAVGCMGIAVSLAGPNATQCRSVSAMGWKDGDPLPIKGLGASMSERLACLTLGPDLCSTFLRTLVCLPALHQLFLEISNSTGKTTWPTHEPRSGFRVHCRFYDLPQTEVRVRCPALRSLTVYVPESHKRYVESYHKRHLANPYFKILEHCLAEQRERSPPRFLAPELHEPAHEEGDDGLDGRAEREERDCRERGARRADATFSVLSETHGGGLAVQRRELCRVAIRRSAGSEGSNLRKVQTSGTARRRYVTRAPMSVMPAGRQRAVASGVREEEEPPPVAVPTDNEYEISGWVGRGISSQIDRVALSVFQSGSLHSIVSPTSWVKETVDRSMECSTASRESRITPAFDDDSLQYPENPQQWRRRAESSLHGSSNQEQKIIDAIPRALVDAGTARFVVLVLESHWRETRAAVQSSSRARYSSIAKTSSSVNAGGGCMACFLELRVFTVGVQVMSDLAFPDPLVVILPRAAAGKLELADSRHHLAEKRVCGRLCEFEADERKRGLVRPAARELAERVREGRHQEGGGWQNPKKRVVVRRRKLEEVARVGSHVDVEVMQHCERQPKPHERAQEPGLKTQVDRARDRVQKASSVAFFNGKIPQRDAGEIKAVRSRSVHLQGEEIQLQANQKGELAGIEDMREDVIVSEPCINDRAKGSDRFIR